MVGGITDNEHSGEFKDKVTSQLFTAAMTSPSVTIRREIMKILGARERAGSEEAAVAINNIKKKFDQN